MDEFVLALLAIDFPAGRSIFPVVAPIGAVVALAESPHMGWSDRWLIRRDDPDRPVARQSKVEQSLSAPARVWLA